MKIKIDMKNKYITNSVSVFLLAIVTLVSILYLVNIVQWRLGPFFGFGFGKFSGWAIIGHLSEDGHKAGFRLGDRVLKANGTNVESLDSLRESVNKEIGALNEFTIERNGKEHTVFFRTTTFGFGQALRFFGISCFIGIMIFCIGAFVFFSTPIENRRWSFFLFCLCAGLVMIFIIHKSLWPSWIKVFELIGFCFLPATLIHMAFIFPFYGDYNPKYFFPILATYIFSLLLFITIKTSSALLSGSPRYLRIFVLCYLFIAIVSFILVLFYQYKRSTSRLAKLKIKVILIGFFTSHILPLTTPILNSIFGIFIFPHIDLVTIPFSLMFPLSIAYAIIKHDLFEIDVFIKRTTGYMLITSFIALSYTLFLFCTNSVLTLLPQNIFSLSQHTINFIFILMVVFFFNPIKNSMQTVVNRLFYRQKYDYKESVKQLLKEISSIFNLNLIIEHLQNILSHTMFIDNINIFLYQSAYDSYSPYNFRLKTVIAAPAQQCIPSSSPLIKLLREEKKELHKDSLYGSPHYTNLREEVYQLFESLRSQLILPFVTHNQLSGFMSLGDIKSGRDYNISDIEFLKIIAGQTAIALENVSLFQDRIEREKLKEELKIAGDIQKRMLPEAYPETKDISIYANIIPSMEIGGDFYDFVEIPSQNGNGWGIVLGDVSGHGISGALLMSAAHSICQNQVMLLKEVIPVMEEANRLMIRETKKKAFVALFLAHLLPDKRISIINAGNPSPLYYNSKSKEARFLENDGDRFPLGIMDDPEYIPLTISLEEGDVIFFYTDGMVEQQNKEGELFSYERLKEYFVRFISLDPEEIANRIVTELRHFAGTTSFEDDTTMIIIKYRETYPLDTTLSLPASLDNREIISQCVKSLAELCSLDETESAQLKADVLETYKHVGHTSHSIGEYNRLALTILQEGVCNRTSTSQEEKGEGHRYCINLLSKDDVLPQSDTGRMIRLIIDFKV
ncbi:MAG: SpoIIE family protein phosphatase [bacterium]